MMHSFLLNLVYKRLAPPAIGTRKNDINKSLKKSLERKKEIPKRTFKSDTPPILHKVTSSALVVTKYKSKCRECVGCLRDDCKTCTSCL